MSTLQALPIDGHSSDISSAAFDRGAVVVAPPGTGKSTRVPPALAERSKGRVVVLQPRRLAARMLAARVASERGSVLGRDVGYEVRHDRKVTAGTRIVYMTAGLFARKMLADPELDEIGCVVIDEFHERQIEADLALALCRHLRTRRPSLGLVVMSATLEPEPIAEYLGGARVFDIDSRLYPIDVRYMPGNPSWKLEQRVGAAVRELADSEGSILVFLPGKGEIQRCRDHLQGVAVSAGFELVALHGGLPAAEQDRATRGQSRRIILATNVAETSVTVPGVTAVVDSGLARVARHSPWTGLSRLSLEPVSQASIEQRAGRAGRLGPGACIRLFEKGDYQSRPVQLPPEVERAELSSALLFVHGIGKPELRWFEPPRPAAWQAAGELLERLGFVAGGAITESGRRALALPTHPRLARIVELGIELGVGASACVAAAAIDAGPIRTAAAQVGSESDVVDEVELLDERSPRGAGIDGRAVGEARRLARQLKSASSARDQRGLDEREWTVALCKAVAAGFLDRVCRRRQRGERSLVIAGIRNAALSAASAVHDAELMVAVDGALLGAAGGRRLEVRRASAVELDWLIELDAEGFEDQDLHELDDGGRVRRVRRLIYAGVVVDEEIATSPERLDGQAASRALLAGLPDPPWRACRDHEAVERLRLRLALLGEPDALSEPVVEQALTEACLGMRTIAEVGKLELAAQLCYRLDSGVREALERQVPEYVGLPGRKRVPVRYQPGRDPYIESRLQDFFGLEELPVVAGQPVVAHLLAPNRRAVQVTRDLPRFWQEHYPTLRRSLMRRYPRHAWPEDPSRIGD